MSSIQNDLTAIKNIKILFSESNLTLHYFTIASSSVQIDIFTKRLKNKLPLQKLN